MTQWPKEASRPRELVVRGNFTEAQNIAKKAQEWEKKESLFTLSQAPWTISAIHHENHTDSGFETLTVTNVYPALTVFQALFVLYVH